MYILQVNLNWFSLAPVIGGVIGGVVIISLIIIVIGGVWYRKKKAFWKAYVKILFSLECTCIYTSPHLVNYVSIIFSIKKNLIIWEYASNIFENFNITCSFLLYIDLAGSSISSSMTSKSSIYRFHGSACSQCFGNPFINYKV